MTLPRAFITPFHAGYLCRAAGYWRIMNPYYRAVAPLPHALWLAGWNMAHDDLTTPPPLPRHEAQREIYPMLSADILAMLPGWLV